MLRVGIKEKWVTLPFQLLSGPFQTGVQEVAETFASIPALHALDVVGLDHLLNRLVAGGSA